MNSSNPDSMTLKEAKEVLVANFDEGSNCLCCGQLVKRYRRALSSSMAYGLVLLYQYDRQHRDQYVRLETYFSSIPNVSVTVMAGGDIAKLRYWGLIEPQPGEREDGSWRLGFYRITQLGRDFVLGQITVSSHVHIYNQKVLGFEGETVSIQQVLSKKFNYRELMGMAPAQGAR